jgi:hypothetical protein
MSEGPTKRKLAAARRYAQPLLTFEARAVSPEAKALVSHCLNELILPSLPAQQRRRTTIPAIQKATVGTLASLIAATGVYDGWTRRPMSTESFTGEGVSRAQFLKVSEPLTDAGLIEVAPGYLDNSGPVAWGAATRLRLSHGGKTLAESYGVLESWQGHFADVTL